MKWPKLPGSSAIGDRLRGLRESFRQRRNIAALRRGLAGEIAQLFDRVYVINLSASVDRREHIHSYFQSLGIENWVFIEALPQDADEVRQAFAQGRVASFPPCFRCGKISCGNDDCNNVLIPAQVANFLSHRRVWETIAREPQFALVVEDDVVFEDYATGTLRDLRHALPAEQRIPEIPVLLRLGWAIGEDHSRRTHFRLAPDIRMSNPAYAMSSAFAKKVLEEDVRVDMTSDQFLHSECAGKGTALTVFPPIASDRSWSQGSIASLIHPKPAHSDYLRSRGKTGDAETNDLRVERHIKHIFARDILIVGHPRCGTGFAANVLRQCGLDIGHESNGADGIASWMFAVEDHAPYALAPLARNRAALVWKRTILPVRNLADAAPSVIRENTHARPSYQYRRKHILTHFGIDLNDCGSELERALTSILKWIELAERLKPDFTFRIEDQGSELALYLDQSGLAPGARDIALDLAPVNQDKAYRGTVYDKGEVSAEDWDAIPVSLREQAREYCRRYGYEPV
jgi:GR25 family glycosyltransferase involved in LPS biosynthesis